MQLSIALNVRSEALPIVPHLGMFITDFLLISNRFRIKCFDSSISISNFDSLFTYDKMLVLVTKNFIKIKSSQKSKQTLKRQRNHVRATNSLQCMQRRCLFPSLSKMGSSKWSHTSNVLFLPAAERFIITQTITITIEVLILYL